MAGARVRAEVHLTRGFSLFADDELTRIDQGTTTDVWLHRHGVRFRPWENESAWASVWFGNRYSAAVGPPSFQHASPSFTFVDGGTIIGLETRVSLQRVFGVSRGGRTPFRGSGRQTLDVELADDAVIASIDAERRGNLSPVWILWKPTDELFLCRGFGHSVNNAVLYATKGLTSSVLTPKANASLADSKLEG